MYIVNIGLFPGVETISLVKILIAIVFFVIVAQFLIAQHGTKGKHSIINTKTLYAVGTAVCRTVFGVGNNYFVKTGTLDPIHSMFVTETLILFVALFRYILTTRRAVNKIRTNVTWKQGIVF